jgi:hypothetical protein
VWICADCNQIIDEPAERSCPKGHGLSRTITTARAFWLALLAGLCLAALAALTRLFMSAGSAAGLFVIVLIAISAVGANLYIRARKWRRQGGAVERLAPQYEAMGRGCLASAGIALAAILIIPALR